MAPARVGKEEVPTYSFRLKFNLSPSDALGIDAVEWVWKINGQLPDLRLRSPKEKPIQDSEELVFKSDGWPSESEAEKAAAKYVPVLKVALAKLRLGADFGDWRPKSCWTEYGLEWLEKKTGTRILNDVHGLMLYQSDPPPAFVSMSFKGIRRVSGTAFEQLFSQGFEKQVNHSDTEEIAFRLFNASFFQRLADARLLLLVMAIESLLEPIPRTPAARAHVESMIQATKEAESLSREEKDSLLGSLSWLKVESIRRTGRQLAEDRLGDREYGGKKAADFFNHVYDLRSGLVHGKKPFPSFSEVGSAAATLEVFVSDLLTQPHL